MIEHRDGDIFEQTDLDGMAHQANCYHTFGSGIARVIREKFPTIYEADCNQTKYGDMGKLGTFSSNAITLDCGTEWEIFNVYGQGGYGKRNSGGRDTNYDALYDGLVAVRMEIDEQVYIEQMFDHYKLGIPHGIGSCLGGGSWRVVEAMLYDIFEELEKVTCVIVKLP